MPLIATIGAATSKSFIASKKVWPQLVNYLMLYDGTLGQSGSGGSNVMSAVTGGITRFYQNASYQGVLTFNANNISISADAVDGRDIAWQTTNAINLTDYDMFFVDGDGAHDPIPAYGPRCLAMYYSTSTPYVGATSLVSGPVNTNYLSRTVLSADISSLNNSFKIGITCQSGGTGGTSRWDRVFTMWLAKNDDWQTWMALGGVTGFSTLDSLLASSTAIVTLMSSPNALEFMVKQCTGTVMSGVVKSSVASNALNNSALAVSKCTANPHWSKFLNVGPY